ncbi:G-protein coupled receptor moody-like [Epargyreus clarus]|uniref:G-protein coupled receptor moody-like n=1 Tax=Epargyreus clarus TaxID=520877 RepID=UPI003C2CEBFA
MSVLINKSLSAVTVNTSAWNLTAYSTDGELAAVKLFTDYPEGLLRFATICCFVFMVIGIPGNIVTIVALARYKKVHNATAMFIMNLSCSDLLFCCFNLPLAASTFYHRAWVHGRLLCRLFPLARYVFVAVSVLTILAITVNRYVMMSHPRLYPKLYKGRNIALMIAAIWISTITTLLMPWFEKWGRFGLDANIGSCSIIPDEKNRSPKTFLFLGAFILPSVAIFLCYTRIFFIVRKSTKKSLKTDKAKNPPEKTTDSDSSSASSKLVTSMHGNDNVSTTCVHFLELPSSAISSNGSERVTTFKTPISDDDNSTDHVDERTKSRFGLRRTALRKSMALLKLSLPTRKDKKLGTMIVAIMVSFCVCHLPITIIKAIRDSHPNPVANIAAYLLLYLSSSVNPLTYVVMSNEYRKAYKNLFRCRRRTKSSRSNVV